MYACMTVSQKLHPSTIFSTNDYKSKSIKISYHSWVSSLYKMLLKDLNPVRIFIEKCVLEILNILSHIRTMCDSAEFFFVFLMPNGQSRFRGCATILLADTQWGQNLFTFEFLESTISRTLWEEND